MCHSFFVRHLSTDVRIVSTLDCRDRCSREPSCACELPCGPVLSPAMGGRRSPSSHILHPRPPRCAFLSSCPSWRGGRGVSTVDVVCVSPATNTRARARALLPVSAHRWCCHVQPGAFRSESREGARGPVGTRRSWGRAGSRGILAKASDSPSNKQILWKGHSDLHGRNGKRLPVCPQMRKKSGCALKLKMCAFF